MKHAILILAHKDFTHLRHLIEYFTKNCYVYVHVDKKADINDEELRLISSMPQVRTVYRQFHVHWGGFSVLEAELSLFKRAYEDVEADYYHLISGQDYPIKPLNAFLNYFEKRGEKDYIEYKPYPITNWGSAFFNRFRFYYLADDVNWQTSNGKRFMGELLKLQADYNVRREPIREFNIIYKGSQWMSLTRDTVDLVLKYTDEHPSFLQRLKYTFAPEESYIHTILLNSRKGKILNNNLRYIRWNAENGNNPSNLSIEHFDDIRDSNAFFARKMERPYCNPLIQLIDRHLLYPQI